MFYSKSTGGFYNEEFHGSRKFTIIKPGWECPQIEVQNHQYDPADSSDGPTIFIDDPEVVPPTVEIDNPDCKIPTDAVEITEAEHSALMEAQSTGKRIQADADGRPVAIEYVPSADELATAIRADRDARIDAVAWRYERNAREVRLGIKPTDDIAALDKYVQALADVTAQKGFPDKIKWPVL